MPIPRFFLFLMALYLVTQISGGWQLFTDISTILISYYLSRETTDLYDLRRISSPGIMLHQAQHKTQ